MYSLKSVLDKQPVAISAAVMAWANLAIIAGWVHLDGKTISGANVALVATLGLFVGTKTANKAVLNELAGGKEGGQSFVYVLLVVLLVILILKLLGAW